MIEKLLYDIYSTYEKFAFLVGTQIVRYCFKEASEVVSLSDIKRSWRKYIAKVPNLCHLRRMYDFT